ncbi:MAG: beta-lactamase family protein [Bifidobacteriaceae bacterium]|jgi:CubicO group peptidase (beta-lactamase class C family)|nr:beta-lactamase family protein [Bifidobacteriaceae bacterium]
MDVNEVEARRGPVGEWTPSEALLAEVERLVGALVAERNAPGAAWGITTRDGLVASGGCGAAAIGAGLPTSSTVFRIASMSKSFTAAAILMLAEAGELRITDPAADYVPSMARMARYSADSPDINLAHLLAMTSGLPVDDPWADRLESMPAAEFQQVVREGFRLVSAPGVRFEYSNAGYALLGLVVERLSEMPFIEFVERHLLEPLGLHRTYYDYAAVPASLRATGYCDRQGQWVPVPFSGPGAFSPIGGLLSNVEDMSKWVNWLAAAHPPTDDAVPSVLSTASRRDMAISHAAVAPIIRQGSSRGRLTVAEGSSIASYGYGLMLEHDPTLGDMAHHSGGYPGFGTAMRWHLDSGIGVIVLANGRYAHSSTIAARVLRVVLAEAGAVARSIRPWPEALHYRDLINAELLAGRDPFDLPIYAENVDADQPLPDRRQALAKSLQITGPLTSAPAGEATSEGAAPSSAAPAGEAASEGAAPSSTAPAGEATSEGPGPGAGDAAGHSGGSVPGDTAGRAGSTASGEGAARAGTIQAKSEAHIWWTLPAERTPLRIEILLTPEHTPRIQTLRITPTPTFPPTDQSTQSPKTRLIP